MKNQIRLILSFMFMAATLSMSAAMPKYNFACHVITENQNVGVNFVQANSENEAYEASLGVKAHIDDEDNTELAAAVMQCIILPGNKFNDYTAQQLLESIPR